MLDDFPLLTKLRSLIYHHSPMFEPTNYYPPALLRIMEMSNLKHINTQWSNWLGHIGIMEWSRGFVVRFIDEFDRCAKRESTFKSLSFGFLTVEEFREQFEKLEGLT